MSDDLPVYALVQYLGSVVLALLVTIVLIRFINSNADAKNLFNLESPKQE